MDKPAGTRKVIQSAKALNWFSVILIVVGMSALSPATGLLCYALAALCAGAALLLSRGRMIIVSMNILIGAVIMVAVVYPAYQTHMNQYQQGLETND
jgi:hypothetical protein